MLPAEWKPYYCPDLVRVGPQHDGGYVIEVSSAKNTDHLVSFGLNDDWRFEEAFQQLSGAQIDCYDHTVDAKFWVRRAIQQVGGLLTGTRRSVDAFKYFRYRSFFNKPNIRHHRKKIGYASENTLSFAQIMQSIESDSVFVKADIEGWEYRILEDIVANIDRLTGLAIEFHDVDLHRERVSRFIEDISDRLTLVCTHANNGGGVDKDGDPLLVEMSFARLSTSSLSRISSSEAQKLVSANLPELPEIRLRFAE